MHHPGPETGQFEHLVVADRRQPTGLGQHPGIGGVDAVNVGVDLAEIGPEHRSQRHGRGVGTAAAECGDVAVLIDSLEACGDHDPAVVEEVADVVGGDRFDAGFGVRAVGADADLRAGEAHRLNPQRLDRHGKQGHAHLLSRGQQHVHFAGAGPVGDLPCQIDKHVGLMAHGADHHDHLIPRLMAGHRFLGRHENLLRIGNACTAEFLHDQSHRHNAPLCGEPCAVTPAVGCSRNAPINRQPGRICVAAGAAAAETSS